MKKARHRRKEGQEGGGGDSGSGGKRRRIFSSKRCRKIERGSYVLKSGRGREEKESEVVAGVKEMDGDVYKRTRRDGCG